MNGANIIQVRGQELYLALPDAPWWLTSIAVGAWGWATADEADSFIDAHGKRDEWIAATRRVDGNRRHAEIRAGPRPRRAVA